MNENMKTKIIKYSTWNEMLKARDEIHEMYIRNYNHGTRWQVVDYSQWDDEFYIGYCGFSAPTLEEVIEYLRNRGYDITKIDICMAE